MAGNLATTNVLIGVMVAMSVVQTLLIVGAGVAAFSLYRRVAAVVDGVDPRQVQQTVAKANAILDDVKIVIARVDRGVESVDAALHSTLDVAEALGSGVRAKTRLLAGAGRGLGVFIAELLRPRARERT